MKTILFVCTGNTCRSSMAEALFKDMIKEYGEDPEKEYNIISAGVAALDGMGASPEAIKAMEEMGIDLGDHKATLLTEEIIESADLILTMTKSHRDMVLIMDPNARDKTYILSSYALGEEVENAPDIIDPFGGSLRTYRESAKEIKGYLKRVMKSLDRDQ